MMVGYSLSGKTTFVSAHPQLRDFFSVETRIIHDLLNDTFAFLQDDRSVNGFAYWERQFWTRYLRKQVLDAAFRGGFGIVSDSCNLRRAWRRQLLHIAQRHGYRTAIVWVLLPQQELDGRAVSSDLVLSAQGKPATWKMLVDQQRKNFEPPLSVEADKLMLFNPKTMSPDQFSF